jgi:hypothetical protein
MMDQEDSTFNRYNVDIFIILLILSIWVRYMTSFVNVM